MKVHWTNTAVEHLLSIQEYISQEKAAMIAGLDRADFLAALAREQIDVFQVDVEELRHELNRPPSE